MKIQIVLVKTFKTSENFIKVKDLFCGLYFLVGFMEQSKISFKAQGKSLYDDKLIGYLDNGEYSKQKSGKLLLIATTRHVDRKG